MHCVWSRLQRGRWKPTNRKLITITMLKFSPFPLPRQMTGQKHTTVNTLLINLHAKRFEKLFSTACPGYTSIAELFTVVVPCTRIFECTQGKTLAFLPDSHSPPLHPLQNTSLFTFFLSLKYSQEELRLHKIL